MRGTRSSVLAAAVVLAAVGPAALWPAAEALTTVRRMAFAEVISSAEVIAAVQVIGIEHDTGGGDGLPYTDVYFSVEDSVKAEGGVDAGAAIMRLQFPGGQTPSGHTMVIAGMPKFQMGDRAMLFVKEGGLCPLVGWWQGLYRLHERDGFLFVTDHGGRPVTGFRLGDGGQRDPMLAKADAGLERAMAYSDFSDVVREIVASGL